MNLMTILQSTVIICVCSPDYTSVVFLSLCVYKFVFLCVFTCMHAFTCMCLLTCVCICFYIVVGKICLDSGALKNAVW